MIVDKNKSVSHSSSQSATGGGSSGGDSGRAVLMLTDYCGSVIYESGKLKRILTPEGYLDANALAVKPTDPGTSINQETPVVIDMKSVMAETLSEVSAATDGERMVVIPTNTGTVIIENPATMASAFRYHYFVNDYLGNVRAVLTWNNGGKQTINYTVTQRNDYYAWGLPTSTSLNPEAQPYKREGKEYDEMHGLNTYDQGARQFGTHLPVTMAPDPMAEKYYSISPYAQWGNNPVRYVDPDGRDPSNWRHWVEFEIDIYKASTFAVTFGYQATADVDISGVKVGVDLNASSFDLVGTREGIVGGVFTPTTHAPEVNEGVKIDALFISVEFNKTTNDEGGITTIEDKSAISLSALEYHRTEKTEINNETKNSNTTVESGWKAADMGIKIALGIGVEVGLNIEKAARALYDLFTK